MEHEVPFRHDNNGQVIAGEIDLLWYTADKECILIDFKNYPGIMSKVLDSSSKEFVGKYAAQLKAYEDALVAAGMTVKTMLIYYSVLGCLVEVTV